MKQRKHWILFAILLLALIGLSPGDNRNLLTTDDHNVSESAPPPRRQEAFEAQNIKVAVHLSSEDFARLQERNSVFVRDHHVQVELLNISTTEAYNKLRHDLALGEAPDVLLLDNVWVREFAEKGYLLPSESYFTGLATNDSIEGIMSANKWNGYIWAVPHDMDPYVLVYNSERMQEFGMNKIPQDLKEWTSLMNAAKIKNKHLIALDLTDPYAVLSLIWRIGGHATPNSKENLHLTGGEKEAIHLLEGYRNLLYSKNGLSEISSLKDDMAQGKAAMAIVRFSNLQLDEGGKLRVEYPKDLSLNHRMWVQGHSFGVASGSTGTQTANAWITAMTEAEEQIRWFDWTGRLPVMKSHYFNSSKPKLRSWLPEEDKEKGGSFFLPITGAMTEDMQSFASAVNSTLIQGTNKSLLTSYIDLINKARP